MGYRSEVILAVGPEVMPQFMVTMAYSEARGSNSRDSEGSVRYTLDKRRDTICSL